MTAYLLKRLAIALATLILASMVVFAVLEIIPGDPARLMLGMNASADQVELLRNQMGLNAPLAVRYLHWAGGLLSLAILAGAPIGPATSTATAGEVTVRSRGVMEKCSYCVQRLRRAEIDTQTQQRPLVDGEVLTACQAACTANAIVFGDLNDPSSAVKRCTDSPLHYALLGHLNTNPRTTYLAELRNPNPELEA